MRSQFRRAVMKKIDFQTATPKQGSMMKIVPSHLALSLIAALVAIPALAQTVESAMLPVSKALR